MCKSDHALINNVVAAAVGHPLNRPSLELGPLTTPTLGMLDLRGVRVAERVKGTTA